MRRRFLFPLALCLWLALAGMAGAAPGPAVITLAAEPSLAEIRPDADLARFQIEIKDAGGKPVDYARVRLQLHAPERPLLLTTDFPVVEGTPLIDTEVIARDGRFTFAYLPPIRGEYQLQVEAAPLEQTAVPFAPTRQEIRFTIHENPEEVVRGSILVLVLVAVGLVSGLVIGRSARAREVM